MEVFLPSQALGIPRAGLECVRTSVLILPKKQVSICLLQKTPEQCMKSIVGSEQVNDGWEVVQE